MSRIVKSLAAKPRHNTADQARCRGGRLAKAPADHREQGRAPDVIHEAAERGLPTRPPPVDRLPRSGSSARLVVETIWGEVANGAARDDGIALGMGGEATTPPMPSVQCAAPDRTWCVALLCKRAQHASIRASWNIKRTLVLLRVCAYAGLRSVAVLTIELP